MNRGAGGTMAVDYDVIVVGGGGAGLAAAVAAHDGGARVLVLESEQDLGGSTAISTGIFLAAGTETQRAAGVEDTPEAMYHHHMAMQRWQAGPALLRTFCEQAAPTLEWLRNFNVGFEVSLVQTGMDTVPRGHAPEGGGATIIQTLQWACRARGVDIALDQRVEEMHVAEGRVSGVRAAGQDVSAHSVVIATGGFGQNGALLREHYPDAVVADRTWSISAPGARGDAFALARQVGAAIDGHNRGHAIPALRAHDGEFSGQFRTVFHWFVYLDTQGRRFVDESAYLSVAAEAIRARGGSCWAVFDEPARLRVGAQLALADLFTGQPLPEGALSEHEAAGRVVRADTLRALAERTGMDTDLLERTITRFNADCADGSDTAFGKHPKTLRSVQTPPFYAAQVAPLLVAVTGCGLRIDAEAQVLDEVDRPIVGLYAAGEATGSWMGDVYVASGNSIANSIVFGRIAGSGAAAYAVSGVGERPPGADAASE